MTISTARDLITLALKTAGVNGVGQSPSAEDANDCLDQLNLMVSEWQLNRWLVYDLVDVAVTSAAQQSYTVGPGGTFVFAGQRPDKVDAVFARLISAGTDTYLYPFMSREGYNRVAAKAATGVPESFFYDPTLGATGAIYFYPVPPVTWSLHVQAKASLGQFTLDTVITLPAAYVSAMLPNLGVRLRIMFQMEPDAEVSAQAAATLRAIAGSVAQVPQVTQPQPSNRAGIYSAPAPK